MYTAFTPSTSPFRRAPPQCGVFEGALHSDPGASAALSAAPTKRHQHPQQQQQPQDGTQLRLQEQQHAVTATHVEVGCTVANPAPEAGSPAVRGTRQQRVHMWEVHRPGYRNQVNADSSEHEQAADGSPKQTNEASAASPEVAAEKPGFLARLLRPGRGEQRRCLSSAHNDRNGQHQQDAAAVAAGRSLTPPASASTLFKAETSAVLPSEKKTEQPASQFTPRQRSRHWLHHQKWKQQQQRTSQPQHHQQSSQQQEQEPSSRVATPRTQQLVPAPSCCSRKSSPFTSATSSVPLSDHQLADRRPGTVTAAFSLPAGVSCMAHPVFSVPVGIPACQHGFVGPGHPALAVSRRMPTFAQKPRQHHRQPFFTAGETSCGLSTQENRLSSNSSTVVRQLLPSYTFENVGAVGMSSQIRYKNPASFVSARSPFGLCSSMAGCFPASSPSAVPAVSEGTTGASACPSTQMIVQTSALPAGVAGVISSTVTAATSSARATGGRGRAVIDPEALNTFNASCFFTQLYLLDSAKRLELIAARISHSMQSRAFSYWVLKHRYPIAKGIWNRKVAKEVAHLSRLRNNLERSRQSYAAETARKRSEADAGAVDKSAELLIIQEQQGEALAEQQEAVHEQLQRVQRYKARRGAVLGSLLLEHGLKRLLYNYQAFSLFALRSNLLTDNDVLQQAVQMLPKFLPPAWKQLDPTRQAELLRSEYAHLVDPATIHLTNLREMYRLHRLDLEARSRRLAHYYRRFFAWTRSFTILECTERSQKRRLLSDAFTSLRHYSWTLRAIQEESVACSAAITRLREAREHTGTAPNSSASNPLVFPPYRRRHRSVCGSCGCISPSCCCCSNFSTSVACRQRSCGPLTNSTGIKYERIPHGTATAAPSDPQSDASLPQHTHLMCPSKTCSAVAGRDEMSGIFFPRYCDGSPVPPQKVRDAARRRVDASCLQHSSKPIRSGSGGCPGSASGRESPTERCSCCNGSSADVQVSCSCCGQTQREDPAGAHCRTSTNAALPSRGMLSNSEMSLSPAPVTPPRPCVSCSSPETAETDAAGGAAATAAAIHQRCGTEGTRTEESCTLHCSESLWAHGSAAVRQNDTSSRIPSPICISKKRHSTRPGSLQGGSAHLYFLESAQQTEHEPQQSPQHGQHQQRQKVPEVHRSCFVEGGATQASRLRRGSSSPVCLSRFSPKATAYAPTGNRSFLWPRNSAHATSQQQQPQEATAGRQEGASQNHRETRVDAQQAPAQPAAGAGGAAAAGLPLSGFIDADAAADRKCSASFVTSIAARQVSQYVFTSPDKNPYLPEELRKPWPVTPAAIHSSINSAATDMSPSAAGAALPSAAAHSVASAANEAERNAALILRVNPPLRSNGSIRPAPVAPVTPTSNYEKRSNWNGVSKPGEIVEVEKVHLVGRSLSNKQ